MIRPLTIVPRSLSLLLAPLGQARAWVSGFGERVNALAMGVLPAMLIARTTRDDVYNVLWALVFAFATINILSLGAKRFEPDRGGLSFGEVLAIMVVLVSVILLGWEMLYLFHFLPIHLTPR